LMETEIANTKTILTIEKKGKKQKKKKEKD
jgi:hypothetical protein